MTLDTGTLFGYDSFKLLNPILAELNQLAEDGVAGNGPLAGNYQVQALIAIAQQLKRLADSQAK